MLLRLHRRAAMESPRRHIATLETAVRKSEDAWKGIRRGAATYLPSKPPKNGEKPGQNSAPVSEPKDDRKTDAKIARSSAQAWIKKARTREVGDES